MHGLDIEMSFLKSTENGQGQGTAQVGLSAGTSGGNRGPPSAAHVPASPDSQ